MLLGLCPECGSRVTPRLARSHAARHWGADPNASELSAEGRRRFNLLLDFANNRFIGPVSGVSAPAKAPPISNRPETPKQNDEDERHWWQLQNRSLLWGAVPVATLVFGLELLRDKNWIFGSMVTVISLFWLLLVDRQMRITSAPLSQRLSPRIHHPTVLIALLAIATWGSVAYDIYDRDFRNPPTHRESKGERNARLKMEFVTDLKGFPASSLRKKTVEVDSSDNADSQEQAGLLVQWFQEAGWTVPEIASGHYVGTGPVAYPIGEGIVVSAPLNNADAEAIGMALCKSGFDARREVVTDDPAQRVVVEVGLLPPANGNSN
jgi:hypothetical protein